MKSTVFTCALALAAIECMGAHPVRPEMVETIKASTSSWTPKEAHLNNLRHLSEEQIKNRMGYKGVSFSHGLVQGAHDFFKQVSDVFGFSL